MRRSVTAESIPTKFCTSTPWGDVVIYLTWHRNRLRGFGGVGCENGPLPLTLALASNTAYCATAHTRDFRRKQTVIHLPTPRENVTTLLVNCKTFSSDWKFVTFFQTLEALKRASCGLSSVSLKRTGCDVWQLECQASNVFRVTTCVLSAVW